jgi:hypothetical protein
MQSLRSLNFTDVNDLIALHHTIKENEHIQAVANDLTYCVCGILMLLNLVLLVRIYFVKEKTFLASLVII